MKKVIAILIFVLTAQIAKAQLFFKNSSSMPVYVAYTMQSNAKDDQAWYSYGWYECDPGQTITLSSVVGLNPNAYYYAKSKDGTEVWDGKNKDGSVDFLVSSKAFAIKNANLQYQKDNNPEYTWESFRHITIGALALKYTIEITD